MLTSYDSDELKNMKEALKSPMIDLWIKTMEEKIELIESNYI